MLKFSCEKTLLQQAVSTVSRAVAALPMLAEYCLPLDFFRLFYPDFRLVPGVRFRGNCYKCGDRTEHPHYLAWNPVNTLSPDFHRPEFLGEMILN